MSGRAVRETLRFLAVVAGLLGAAPVSSQVAPPTVGERVWASTDSGIHSGTVSSVSPVSLKLENVEGTVLVSYDRLRELLVQRPGGRHTLLGLFVGAGAGAALGFAWGYGPQTIVGGGWRQWEFAGYGAIPGALVGMLVGFTRTKSDWVNVPLEGLVIGAPDSAGGTLSLRWSFTR